MSAALPSRAQPGNRAWRAAEAERLLDVALKARVPEGGYGWLDDAGRIDRTQGRPLWITARMTHVMAIGTLLGHPGCRAGLDHGVAALTGVFRDGEYGGWYPALDWPSADGHARRTDTTKAAYPHAFVVLAAASATVAGADAVPLLYEALAISSRYFWDPAARMMVEEWDETFGVLDPYRGANANMHTVEAYLAAADALACPAVTGSAFRRSGQWDAGAVDPDPAVWRARALAIADRLINREARANNWRIPEHFDAAWHPQPDLNRDHPADQFRPYGATIGHGLEWARLCLTLAAALSTARGAAPGWLAEAAEALYDRALADGWAVDGADGFVYTTDWDGTPIVHERMHWVVAEAIGAGHALARAGRRDTTADVTRWWEYAAQYLIDPADGSWCHELDRHNRPSATVWSGRPDVYHAIQAMLLPDLPLAPTLVAALANHGGHDVH